MHVAGVGACVGFVDGEAVGAGVIIFDLQMRVPAGFLSGVPQLTLAQSSPTRHAWPSAHFGQLIPPQSTSVSSPSLMLFAQLIGVGAGVGSGVFSPSPGLLQMPCVSPSSSPGPQCVLTQSVPTKQSRPLVHLAHTPPPQSTSVSAPFREPSEQVAATGVGEGVGDSVGAGVSH